MKPEMMGIVRTVVAAVGGILVSKGYLDADTSAQLAGAVTVIVVAVFSILNKRKAKRDVAAALVTPVPPGGEVQ